MEQFAHINNLRICFETFGTNTDPAVLLIMGNSAQGIMWPEAFCKKLAKNSLFVIRYDQRDTGKSTCVNFDDNPYNLFDLASDALGLLDELDIKNAHIVGLSMGASIAQLLALHHAGRVISITSMMSSPDLSIKNDAMAGKETPNSILPPPDKDWLKKVLKLNDVSPKTKQDKIRLIVENWKLANGDKVDFDFEEWQQLIEAALDRQETNPSAKDLKIANHGNHSKAQIATDEPNLEVLKLVNVPTLVIHGKEDPIFPPAHAEMLGKTIPNARLVVIDDMGHTLNPTFFDEIIHQITLHIGVNADVSIKTS
ncbi:alpha/beta fold hydrolase [Candidatus Finniella inopinata]|uniref:Alpha/beta hydrolase n=1 Tax=Candidatus Finniella inopinata TaxID=1696036 RepID=A0A4Q7DJE1_9PROT|nr:alpha/beta hydrolase [Candidatus Finniella inopinata]RZI46460.1 alpha/beta hydrolase [Candidatus Finniella inopinata]